MPTGPRKGTTGSTASQKKKTLSWFAGAGSGSGMVLWVNSLSLEPQTKQYLLAAAPWASVAIAAMLPIFTGFCMGNFRYWGVTFFLHRQKTFVASIPDDEANKEHKEKANASVRELESILMDLNKKSAKGMTVSTD